MWVKVNNLYVLCALEITLGSMANVLMVKFFPVAAVAAVMIIFANAPQERVKEKTLVTAGSTCEK